MEGECGVMEGEVHSIFYIPFDFFITVTSILCIPGAGVWLKNYITAACILFVYSLLF